MSAVNISFSFDFTFSTHGNPSAKATFHGAVKIFNYNLVRLKLKIVELITKLKNPEIFTS